MHSLKISDEQMRQLQECITSSKNQLVESSQLTAAQFQSLQGLLAEKEAFIKLQEQAKQALDRANETISTLQDNLVDAQNNFAVAANNLNGSASTAKSGKIICTELYNQGFPLASTSKLI